MRLINKHIYYAFRSLCYMADNPKRIICITELTKVLNMRRAFLRRIMTVLAKGKILKSLKGKGGGFVLNINPSQIRVIDVIKVFKGKIDIMNCLFEKDVCPYPDSCVLMVKMKGVGISLYKILEKTTIAILLKSQKKRIRTKVGGNGN
ncbi:MAG: Rrf2 family transcriptional regulator [Candidatus Omnitrophica bacterium]|nr:Rrf2 family transcriptional regulator [Candidatus Omnitrophota bacterium]